MIYRKLVVGLVLLAVGLLIGYYYPPDGEVRDRDVEVPPGFDSLDEWREFKRRYKESHGYPKGGNKDG